MVVRVQDFVAQILVSAQMLHNQDSLRQEREMIQALIDHSTNVQFSKEDLQRLQELTSLDFQLQTIYSNIQLHLSNSQDKFIKDVHQKFLQIDQEVLLLTDQI